MPGRTDSADNALDAQVLDQAAAWLLQIHSGEAAAADQQALQQWRAQHADHERAWQRAQQFLQGIHDIPADVSKRVLIRRNASARRRAVRQLMLLGVVAPSAWLVCRQTALRNWTADYRTATGELQHITLSDGSRLTLNTASALDVRFDEAQRLIRLRAGEVLITSGTDNAPRYRPLIVVTDEGRVQAMGTRFSVREFEGRSHAAVYDGAVEVRGDDIAGQVTQLSAGQQASFTKRGVTETREVESVAELWSQGMLVVTDMKLADLLAELDRYRSGKLRCDAAVAELRISGAFPLTDITRSLALIQSTLPVRINAGYWARVEAR